LAIAAAALGVAYDAQPWEAPEPPFPAGKPVAVEPA
jgi:hypothetical protein